MLIQCRLMPEFWFKMEVIKADIMVETTYVRVRFVKIGTLGPETAYRGGPKFDERSLSSVGLNDAYIVIRLACHLCDNSVMAKA